MNFLKKYFKFVYEKYIYEDFSIYTYFGLFFIKPAWFVRSIYVYLYSIIFFPLVYSQYLFDNGYFDNYLINIIKKINNMNDE